MPVFSRFCQLSQARVHAAVCVGLLFTYAFVCFAASQSQQLTHLNLSSTGMTQEDMPDLLNQIQRFSRVQHLKLCGNFVNETMIAFVCCNFPCLISLNVSNNSALINIPPGISLLKNLNLLDVSNCKSMLTFPDELLRLTRLTDIKAKGCFGMTYPPKTFTEAGREKIFEFLQKAFAASPLKRVKVMFLGNGRSGKTSLIHTLAKKPLSDRNDPGPKSTQGVSVDPLHDLLTPSKLDKLTNGGLPDMSFWDFAGQLEYSAAHDFFMSHRQAVYVIVFSVVEDRWSQMNQVAYWLRTVAAKGVSEHVRFLLVGTKVDLIEGDWNSQEVRANCRRIEVDMQSVVQSCCGESIMNRYQILFVTSVATHSHYSILRRQVKGSIFALCKSIFSGNPNDLKMLRFPQEYKLLLDSIEELKLESWELPLLKLENLTDVRKYGEHLSNAHQNPVKIEALRVLHDVGAIIFCMIKEGDCEKPWICLKPQVVADVIAVFADPQSGLFVDERACATQQQLEEILVEKYLQSKTPTATLSSSKANGVLQDNARKLFGFLLALRILLPIEVAPSATTSSSPSKFIVPSALKGRPSFWREVLDLSAFAPENSCLRGFRYTCMNHIITVAAFVKTMSSMCSNPQRMWGCAFSFDIQDDGIILASIFVRLAEGRNFIDMIVIGSGATICSQGVLEKLDYVASQLNCRFEMNDRLYLCPHCCSSDMFVRSGAAHAFHHKQVSASGPTPTFQRPFAPVAFVSVHKGGSDRIASAAETAPFLQRYVSRSNALSCSRYHEVHKDELLNGLCVGMLGSNDMPAMFPKGSSTRDVLPWKQVLPLGIIEFGEGFKILPNSFFVLTEQLRDGELLSLACMQSINNAISSNSNVCHLEPPMHREGCNSPLLQLRLRFSVGSNVGVDPSKKVVAAILSCRSTCVIENVDGEDVTTNCDHALISGTRVMLSNDGTVYRVSSVISSKQLRLVKESNEAPSDLSPQVLVGTTIIPMLDSFSFTDNVLVLYHLSQTIFTGKRPVVEDDGKILEKNFFALTRQLRASTPQSPASFDIISRASLQTIESAVTKGSVSNIRVQVQQCNLSIQPIDQTKVIYRNLQLRFNVGESIDGKRIEYVLSCVQKAEVESASESGDVTTICDHGFEVGTKVLLSVPEDNGGKVQGVICKVSAVKSSKILTLAREPPSEVPIPLALARGFTIAAMLDSFSAADHVSVILKQRPPFTVLPGVTNQLHILPLEPNDCSRSTEATCWREVEDNWAIMLGDEFENYEITEITLLRCAERDRLFLKEIEHLQNRAKQLSSPIFSCAVDSTDEAQHRRSRHQKQVMDHFRHFTQKFCLMPAQESVDINVCVAWWGNLKSVFHTVAQNGFWDLPSLLKLDPGYYGAGFYLTRYPRYSDYYVNSCNLFERKVEKGNILMCYSALGRPYPVTQDPYKYPKNHPVPGSLYGKPCGVSCGCTAPGGCHDSHYVSVKMHPDAKHFFPCPERQEPDFDEIVVFKPERILPAAYVSYQRR
jgi:GTPase SAR1 family protein